MPFAKLFIHYVHCNTTNLNVNPCLQLPERCPRFLNRGSENLSKDTSFFHAERAARSLLERTKNGRKTRGEGWKLLDVMVEEGSMFYFAWHGTS
jgi:hypothetical protein